MTNELLGKVKVSPLPETIPPLELPENFCSFFSDKIKSIREDLDSHVTAPPSFSAYNGPKLTHFEPVTEKDVSDVISSMPSKSCPLDPIPTDLLKQCLPEIVPAITSIINSSLTTGVVPDAMKQAIVTLPPPF